MKSLTEVEVVAKGERRRFTGEYKAKVLREADSCKRPGEIGALLQREGLYLVEFGQMAQATGDRRAGGAKGEEARAAAAGEKPVSREGAGVGAGQCAA